MSIPHGRGEGTSSDDEQSQQGVQGDPNQRQQRNATPAGRAVQVGGYGLAGQGTKGDAMSQNQDPNFAQGGQQGYQDPNQPQSGQQWNQNPNQPQSGQQGYQDPNLAQGGQQGYQDPNLAQGGQQGYQDPNQVQSGQQGYQDPNQQMNQTGGYGNNQPNQSTGQQEPVPNQTGFSRDVRTTTEQRYSTEVDQSTSQTPAPNQGGQQMGDPNVDPNARQAQGNVTGDPNAQQADENRGGLGSKLGNLFNRNTDPNADE